MHQYFLISCKQISLHILADHPCQWFLLYGKNFLYPQYLCLIILSSQMCYRILKV
uniref:Uncharacterized protein n=1 Tax=Rhizophora mucronata TaxID=61149 RepID=A0A2P2QFM5_RHIMU